MEEDGAEVRRLEAEKLVLIESYMKLQDQADKLNDRIYQLCCGIEALNISITKAKEDEAARKATRYMIDYLVATRSLSRAEAYMLCSLAGDLKIAETVDIPHMLVTMHMPKSIFVDRFSDRR